MCGIAGIRKFGEEPISKYEIAELLVGIEHRGTDATGVALVDDKWDVQIFKQDQPAWKMLLDEGYKKFLTKHLTERTQIALLHTRAATKGNPRQNENNHPVWNGISAVVHNGMIYNDDTLFKEMNLDRQAEVDSDIIRAIVDKFGVGKKGIRKLNRMSGWVASLVVSKAAPGYLLVLRSGGDLEAANVRGQHLMFASEKQAIHRAARVWVNQWGIPFHENRGSLAFIRVHPDSAWVIGPKGLEWRQALKTLSGSKLPRDFSTNYTDYSGRQEKWDRDTKEKSLSGNGTEQYTGITLVDPSKQLPPPTKPSSTEYDMVICPNPKCGHAVTIGEKFKHEPLESLICMKCEGSLAGAVLVLNAETELEEIEKAENEGMGSSD